MPNIALLPGDGIGPEVAAAAVAGPERRRRRPRPTTSTRPAAPPSTLHGTALTDEALAACKASDAVLLGAARRPEVGHQRARRRAARSRACSSCAPSSACTPTCARSGRCRALYDASPLKRELIEGVDMLIVRELTGGLYYGERGTEDGRALRHDGLHRRGDRADRARRLRGGQVAA